VKVPDLLPSAIGATAGLLDGMVIRLDEKRETSAAPTKRGFRTSYRMLLGLAGFATEYFNGDPRISASLFVCSATGLATEAVDYTFGGAY
jgi:hypothetical protein